MRKLCSLSTLAVLIFNVAASAQDQTVPPAPALGVATPGEKSLIRLHVQTGQTYLMRVTMDSKMTQIMPKMLTESPQRMDIASTNTMSMLYAVTGVADDGTIIFKTTYHAIQVKATGRIGAQVMPVTTYDSMLSPKSSAPEYQPLNTLIGQSVTMKVMPDGQIVDMQGMDNIRRRLMAAFNSRSRTKASTKPSTALFDNSFTSFLSDKYFKESLARTAFSYPLGAVGIGDSWPYKVSTGDQLPISVNGTRTLRDHKNGLFYIDAKGSIYFNSAHPLQVSNQMQTIYHISGTQTGSSELDEATGFIQKAQTQQRFGGNFVISGMNKLKGGAALPQKMTVPIYSKTTISIEVTPFTE